MISTYLSTKIPGKCRLSTPKTNQESRSASIALKLTRYSKFDCFESNFSLINISMDKKIKINNEKLTKWMLRIKKLLSTYNNTLLSALLMWKSNIDREFEGIDECPICYFIVHATTKQLPELKCRTCKKLFHSVCIQKWFNTSGKNECPLCKSQFW